METNRDILETVVPGRMGEGGEESDIRLRLNAPGQRGILQSIMDVKKSAARILPKYGDVITKSKSAVKKHRRKVKELNKLERALNKAKRYVDLAQLLNTDLTEASITRRAKLLTNIAACIEASLVLHASTSDTTEDVGSALQEGIKDIDELSRGLQGELKRVSAVGNSWMDVKWTADNPTAVGRGPPGHLAYSPFQQYKLPYDVAEVRKVIEESSRRVR